MSLISTTFSYTKHIGFALILLLCISCGEEESSSIDFDLVLDKCWTHSFEEDFATDPQNPQVNTYRPCDFKEYEYSFYRATYTFNLDGTCTFLALSPVDSHFFTEGHWEFDKETNTLEVITASGLSWLKTEVIETSESRLRFQRPQ